MYIIYWDARKDDLQGTSDFKASRVFAGLPWEYRSVFVIFYFWALVECVDAGCR